MLALSVQKYYIMDMLQNVKNESYIISGTKDLGG